MKKGENRILVDRINKQMKREKIKENILAGLVFIIASALVWYIFFIKLMGE